MEQYRAYVIGRDGHIARAIELHCADDEDAKARAQELVDDCAIELWQRARRVARFAHEPEHPTTPPISLSEDALERHARATEALEAARLLPPGPEKTEALKQAGLLRKAAGFDGPVFAKRGRPPK